MNVAVIIPAYNEAESIGKVLKEIPSSLVQQVIVADNGSTDETASIAESLGAIIVSEKKRGYGYACIAGIGAIDESIDTLVFIDGDYSDYPEEIEILLRPIKEDEADFVIGSRTRGAREKGALPAHSLAGNFILSYLFSSVYGFRVTDIGPFRAIRRKDLERMNMTPAAFRWTVEMMAKGVRMGLRMKEIPVSYRKRTGISKITGTIRGTILAAYNIIVAILKFRLWNEK